MVKLCMCNLHLLWKISTEKNFGKIEKKFRNFSRIFLKNFFRHFLTRNHVKWDFDNISWNFSSFPPPKAEPRGAEGAVRRVFHKIHIFEFSFFTKFTYLYEILSKLREFLDKKWDFTPVCFYKKVIIFSLTGNGSQAILSWIPKRTFVQATLWKAHRVSSPTNPDWRAFDDVRSGKVDGDVCHTFWRHVTHYTQEKSSFQKSKFMILKVNRNFHFRFISGLTFN